MLKRNIQEELDRAVFARTSGNEGMARVCARRAAGLILKEYLTQMHIDASGRNIYEILKEKSLRKHIPVELHQALDRLTTRVNEDYTLPEGFDLIDDAKLVSTKLTEELTKMTDQSARIIMYGTTWCSATKRARRLLDSENIPYDWVDIDQDEAAARFVMSVANGFRSVPTLVFPDGTILVEPSSFQLSTKLGI